MSIEAILAAVFFVGLFTAWVILPHHLQKRHLAEENDDTIE